MTWYVNNDNKTAWYVDDGKENPNQPPEGYTIINEPSSGGATPSSGPTSQPRTNTSQDAQDAVEQAIKSQPGTDVSNEGNAEGDTVLWRFQDRPFSTTVLNEKISTKEAIDKFRQIYLSNQNYYNNIIAAMRQRNISLPANPDEQDVERAFKRALAVSTSNDISWEDFLFNKSIQIDPTSYQKETVGPSAEDIKASRENIKMYAVDLGVELNNQQLNALALENLQYKYTVDVLKSKIVQSGTINFGEGAAATTFNTLKQTAFDNGVNYDDAWFRRAATNILTGSNAIEDYDTQIREYAKSAYPTLAKQLDAGFTVRQVASPYIQTMANLWETNATGIDLTNPMLSKALKGLDVEGNPKQMPLWEFEIDLRKDPQWAYTNNAQQSVMSTARTVLKDFGLAY